MRRLSTEALAEKLSRARIKHRRAIERWLDSYVNAPPCGCKLKWEWLWARGDWILPIGVAVAPLAKKRCKHHKGNYFDTEEFAEQLSEVLLTVRKNTKLGIESPTEDF